MSDVTRFRASVSAWVTDAASRPPHAVLATAEGIRLVVLVEGESDRAAIEALAELRGRDPEREGVVVLPMQGAMNVRKYVERLGPHGLALPLAGLCDVGEERYFRRALQDGGVSTQLSRNALESLGFFVCDADLEDELIRALGTDRVESVMAEQGDLRAFRIFQNQPAQRGRAVNAQQHRFLGSIGGRKSRYARALVEALGPEAAPRPLARLADLLVVVS